MSALEQLREQLDRLANAHHGRLPQVRRYGGWRDCERIWIEKFPSVYEIVALGGITVEDFRFERDEAVRRWQERRIEQRRTWETFGEGDKRVTKATFLRPEMRRLYDAGYGVK